MASTQSPTRASSLLPSATAAGSGIDLEHRDVGVGIAADDLGLELAPVEQPDRDLLGAFDHVVVGEDVAVGRDDEAGAAALLDLGLLAERGEKKRSMPGGIRCWVVCSVRCDRMYTTLGLTCSATAANASLSSCSGRAAGMDGAATGAMAEAGRPCSCAEDRLGRSRSPANSSPSANARATKPPNLSQFNDRADIERSYPGTWKWHIQADT